MAHEERATIMRMIAPAVALLGAALACRGVVMLRVRRPLCGVPGGRGGVITFGAGGGPLPLGRVQVVLEHRDVAKGGVGLLAGIA